MEMLLPNRHPLTIKGAGLMSDQSGKSVERGGTKITIKGNVSGTYVNIGGTMNINAIPNAKDEEKEELKQLVDQLDAELAKLKADHPDDVETVQLMAKEAVAAAEENKPKKLIEIKAEGLKAAAENLLAVAPIAARIAAILVGLP
jgi:predicted AlkP superfamily phosphohydrolase/phosphomutase